MSLNGITSKMLTERVFDDMVPSTTNGDSTSTRDFYDIPRQSTCWKSSGFSQKDRLPPRDISAEHHIKEPIRLQQTSNEREFLCDPTNDNSTSVRSSLSSSCKNVQLNSFHITASLLSFFSTNSTNSFLHDTQSYLIYRPFSKSLSRTSNTTEVIEPSPTVHLVMKSSSFFRQTFPKAADLAKLSILISRFNYYLSLLLLLLLFLHLPRTSCAEPTTVSIHAIIPHHFAMSTELTREISSTMINFKRDMRNQRLRLYFTTEEHSTFIRDDTPREILDAFCKGVLAQKAITILNINNPLGIRRRTSSNQYILEIASYLGIPVISWDTQFSGSSHAAANDRILQLAPTIDHQAMAMMSLLERYNWTSFTIVTSQVAGDAQFVAAMETLVEQRNNKIKSSRDEVKRESSRILSTIHISDLTEVQASLKKAVGTDTRVFLLHSSSRASYEIVETAVKLGLTGKDFVWILTRSSIPTGKFGTDSFPVGLLGMSFEYDLEAMKRVVRAGVKMFLYALMDMTSRPADFANLTIPPSFNCNTSNNVFWRDGDIIYRHMLKVSIRDEPQIEFNNNGTLKRTEVIIVNLQWSDAQKDKTEWKEVGRWKRHGLQMQDITWPGESSMPPAGKPRRAFLRVATLNELPYVIYRLPKDDGVCEENSLPCQVYQRNENKEIKTNVTILRCCVGFSMDLLKILSAQLDFDFVLTEVEDGKWGSINKATKQWNGLVKVLLDDQADIVMTAMKINPERAEAVRFSVPYLETGIKIIVALREGAISPTAFLEPFDFFSWILIMVLSVHVVGSIIFLFDRAVARYHPVKPEHRFSLFRSFWLIWAMLFSTSVQTDSPKGIASRFLANIWALFALVFLASYTANLAAFMITKEVYYDLSGIQDYRLQNPYTMKPPFKYATIPNGSTEANIRANHKDMFNYMKPYNLPDVDAGIAALKQGKIQAFIYDSSVLEYYASRDPQCRLVTVGNRYAMTGYGVGFQSDFQNPWIDKFNKVILKLQETGELDRLQKFWLSGACNMNKETGVSNRTLGIINFTSAFILLGTGVLLGLLILCCEHVYFTCLRRHIRKWDKCGCCSLVSLSLGKSLHLETCKGQPGHQHCHTRCRNARCETEVWKLKHQLDMALLKIDNLQNQLSGDDSGTLQLRPTPLVLGSLQIEDSLKVVVRANGMGRRNTTPGLAGIKSSMDTTAPKSSTSKDTKSSAARSNQKRHRDSKKNPSLGDSSKFTSFTKGKGSSPRYNESDNPDSSDSSPVVTKLPDAAVLSNSMDESPGLGEDNREENYGLIVFGDANARGSTYVGFDDLSSMDDSGGLTEEAASPSSLAHGLRRTPSYTSAIGSTMKIQPGEDGSPGSSRRPRVRQYDGKKYVGVDGDCSPT